MSANVQRSLAVGRSELPEALKKQKMLADLLRAALGPHKQYLHLLTS